MLPTTSFPIGAGIFEEHEIDYTMTLLKYKYGNVERMIVYLFVKDFLDRLRTAQHNPMVLANANLIHFSILLGPFAKSLGCFWRKT